VDETASIIRRVADEMSSLSDEHSGLMGTECITAEPTQVWPHYSLICATHTHTHNRFTALLEYVRDHPGEQVPER